VAAYDYRCLLIKEVDVVICFHCVSNGVDYDMNTLSVKRLRKDFIDKSVLREVTFSVQKGEVLVILGNNGSGKTTLINLISGLETPDYGEIDYSGKSLIGKSQSYINKIGISRTFQDIKLINNMTCFENVMLSFKRKYGESFLNIFFKWGLIQKEEDVLISDGEVILDKCFLRMKKNIVMKDLSFGEKKLLSLACCMATMPKIMILDEPFSGMNILYRDKIKDIIIKNKMEGLIVIVIEHDNEYVRSFADKVYILDKGIVKRI